MNLSSWAGSVTSFENRMMCMATYFYCKIVIVQERELDSPDEYRMCPSIYLSTYRHFHLARQGEGGRFRRCLLNHVLRDQRRSQVVGLMLIIIKEEKSGSGSFCLVGK